MRVATQGALDSRSSAPEAVSGVLDGSWSIPPPPYPQFSPVLVYDSSRNRVIDVGDASIDIQSWSLDTNGGGAWTRIVAAGQPQASGHGFYDPIRDRVLVFDYMLEEIWQLTLSGTPTWSPVHTTGPSPPARLGYSVVYDSHRDRVIIFGGESVPPNCFDCRMYGDTWALDLASRTWTKLDDTYGWPPPWGPRPRRDAGAIYDPVRDRMVVFGGAYGDAWAFDLESQDWLLLDSGDTGGPGPRSYFAAIFEPAGDRMLIAGGTSSGTMDVWALSLGMGGWTQLAPIGVPPDARYTPGLAYDPMNQRAILFGGSSTSAILNDVWSLALAGVPSWTHLLPAPPGREGHTAILDPARDRMIVHGGVFKVDQVPHSRSDTWSWSLSDNSWSEITASGTPPARGHHSAVLDAAEDRMLVWGGNGADTDVWSLDLASASWSKLTVTGDPPPPRSSHCTIFDPVRRRMIVFGGLGLDLPTYRSDVWALDLSGGPHWSQLQPSGVPPAGRAGATAIYDPTEDRMLVFGGAVLGGARRNDLWALSLAGGGAWTSIPTQNPPPERAWHAAIYDEGRTSLVIHGGQIGERSQDAEVWSWIVNGSSPWRHLAPTGTAPIPFLQGHSAAYDPARNRMISFGGYANQLAILDWGSSPLAAPEPPRGGTWLAGVFPNPARGAVSLQFAMAAPGNCALEVFDVAGKRVAKLLDGRIEAGVHRAQWNGRDARDRSVSSGIYFVRLSAGRLVETRRLVMLEGAK